MLFFVHDFVTEIQNPSIYDPRFEEFVIPYLDDFIDGGRNEHLLCPIRAFRK